MNGVYDMQNIGAVLATRNACSGKLTAGGSGDAVKVTGNTIDRMPSGGTKNGDTSVPAPGFLSCCLTVAGQATLADTQQLLIAAEIQDSADGTNWNTAVALQASTPVAKSSGGTTEKTWVNKIDVNLKPYARYVRFNVTPDLDASGTDTALWAAVATLGGADQLPVGQAAILKSV
jgi:hypothetical protein